jgi:hypothetical protein
MNRLWTFGCSFTAEYNPIEGVYHPFENQYDRNDADLVLLSSFWIFKINFFDILKCLVLVTSKIIWFTCPSILNNVL